jgi:GT2 family glycosyltransferase
MTNLIYDVIIPTLHGAPPALRTALTQQRPAPRAIIDVRGVRPNGLARNRGVAQSAAPWLVFIDDDALPGDDRLCARLIEPMLHDPTIGVSGSAKCLPPESSWFQQRVAREIPRVIHAVVSETMASDPDPPHFFSAVTTTCCATRRSTFDAVGGFDPTLVRGVDTEWLIRVRRTIAPTGGAYRIVQAAAAWVSHPAPASLSALLVKHFWYGYGHAQEVRRDPRRARGRMLTTPWHTAAYAVARTLWLLPSVVVPFSYAEPSWRPGFRPLKALALYAGVIGYCIGWHRAA